MTDTAHPDPPALPDELDRLLARLRLPYLRRHAPHVVATARSQRWDPAEVLRVLLAEEAAGRDAATGTSRRKQAGFPAGKTLDSWDDTEWPWTPALVAAFQHLRQLPLPGVPLPTS